MSDERPVPPIVLASASPRRANLLRMLGLEFDVEPADLEETIHSDEAVSQAVERLAREKAWAVASSRPEALVIGSDTVVSLRGEVLGKPDTEDDAVAMLLRLQGREHHVATGIAVAAPGGRIESSFELSRVRFRTFGEHIAREYVATGEPMDKAGAYGIQGVGSTLVEAVEGDFFAVMGLPIGRMMSLLEALGWRYNFRGLEHRD